MLLVGLVRADQVTLTNGDRLTGKVVRADEKVLILKTDLVGEVSIPRGNIGQISTDEPVFLVLTDSQVLCGTVATAEGKYVVSTKNAGPVTVPRETVVTVRSQAEQAAFQAKQDRYANPGLLDLWTGSVDLGVSVASGNTRTFSMALGGTASRTTRRDKTTVYFSSMYDRNSTTGVSVVTANRIRGGGRYEISPSERLFVFGSGDLEHDRIQALDLRMVLGGGIGYYFRRDAATQFQVFGGGALNKEFYESGVRRTSGEAMVGEEYATRFFRALSFSERCVVFPNLSKTGEFRLTFDAGLATAVNRWLDWHLSFSDRYLSDPPFGNRKNDTSLTTGLRFKFQR